MLRSAIQSGLLPLDNLEAKLRGDHDFCAEGSESLAHEFFIGKRAIHFGSVKECDTAFDSRPDQRDPLLLLYGWAQAKAQSHAAEPDRRHF